MARFEESSHSVAMSRMDDTPEWIRRKSQERLNTAAKRIRDEGLQFFSELLAELEKNTKALPEIGAYGRVANLAKPAEKQQRCRVDVGQKGKAPGVTHTDLFYMVGRSAIQSRTQEDEVATYRLRVMADGEIGAIPNEEFEQLTAQELAERIVREAVERLVEMVY